MADSHDTGGRLIAVFQVSGSGVKELDLGRAYRQVVLSCEPGVSGDELLFCPASYDQLGSMSTGAGWRRLGPLATGAYVLEQLITGPVRYICFQWATGGVVALDVVAECLDSQSNIAPSVTRSNPVLAAKP